MSSISKLGLGIVAFDDTCHLKNMVSEVRDLCDVIVICLQKLSYHGDPIKDSVIDYVTGLQNDGLVDHIIWFENTEKKEQCKEAPRLIETDKRNFILDFLERDCGCSHSMVTDSDEFYDHDDFYNAKQLINTVDDIHVTYCQYINYYRDYQHVMVWPFLCYVPFITEAKYRFDFHRGSLDKPSDPTRRYVIEGENGGYCILSFELIKMHHLSWIRKNIEDKINNWSSKLYFDMDSLKDKIIDRYNNYKDGLNAIIMFNVPEHEVVVNKLPDQYIHPKYSLLD